MQRLTISTRLRAVVLVPDVLVSTLNMPQRLGVAVLASHGEASWPSVKRVAALMGCSVDTARRTLHELQRLGWLTIDARKKPDGSPTSNLYRLGPPGPEYAVQTTPNTTGGYSQSASTVPAGCEPNSENNLIPGIRGIPARARIATHDVEESLRESTPVGRLLGDYRLACREILGREPVIFYARDGRLLKRVLASFSEQMVVQMFRRFIAECKQHNRPITIPAFFGASERLGQTVNGAHGGRS